MHKHIALTKKRQIKDPVWVFWGSSDKYCTSVPTTAFVYLILQRYTIAHKQTKHNIICIHNNKTIMKIIKKLGIRGG